MTEKSKRSSQRRKARWGIDCISSSKPMLQTLIFNSGKNKEPLKGTKKI